MADNIAVTAGAGTSVATDDIGGVHYQRVKATWGADGTATDIQATAAAALPVNQVSNAYQSSASITRPANVTAYQANDVIGGVWTFTGVGPANGTMQLIDATLEMDIAALPTGMTGMRLHAFSVTPPSALSDNGAFTLPSGDRAAYLGYIDFDTALNMGATLISQMTNINKVLKLGASGSVFCYLQTLGGFTPANNSEVYKVTLNTAVI